MRPYRGLTTDGKWVYGWYCFIQERQYTDGRHPKRHFIIQDDAEYMLDRTEPNVFDITEAIEVIPETVGQQAGKLDISHKEIYGKDIVKWENSVYQQIWEVREISGGWEIASLPKSDDEPRTIFDLMEFHQPLKVIGNIHQKCPDGR